MRLVDQKRLALDDDVNASLTSWRLPANVLDKDNPVTLRGLLSMTAGFGVMGFLGYELGAPLPTLTQILDGTPPANSAPVTVIRFQAAPIIIRAAATRSPKRSWSICYMSPSSRRRTISC